MKKMMHYLLTKEAALLEVIGALPIRPVWFVITLVWSILGIYLYNEKLATKNILTEVLFMAITLGITWQNRGLLIPFFKNPFQYVGKNYPISNIIWIYPFGILMASVLFVAIPNLLGWVHADPQKIGEMTFSLTTYIGDMVVLPVLVIGEESMNVLLLIVISKFLASKMKHGWLPLAVLLTAIFFGGLHTSAWGTEAAIARMFIHMPFLGSVVILRSAWPSILAHIYQNGMTYTSVLNEDIPTEFVKYGLLACMFIWASRYVINIFKRKQRAE